MERLYYSIQEVAELLDLNPSALRFWEKEFNSISPRRDGKGKRYYTKDQVDHIKLIYHLVKERGMTLKGARKKISENPDNALKNFEIVERLKSIRGMLIEIIEEMDNQGNQPQTPNNES